MCLSLIHLFEHNTVNSFSRHYVINAISSVGFRLFFVDSFLKYRDYLILD